MCRTMDNGAESNVGGAELWGCGKVIGRNGEKNCKSAMTRPTTRLCGVGLFG